MKYPVIIITLLGAVITASAQIFLKKGMNVFSFVFLSILTNYYLMIGCILYFMAAITLLIALKYGELSVLYPIYSTSYIWVALLSAKLLNETLNLFKWIGIIFILLGVIFVTGGKK